MRPANYSGLLRAIFAGAAVAGVVTLLAGCDLSTSTHAPDYGGGYTFCTNYLEKIVEYKTMSIVDSTATCAGGSAPVLARVDWVSTDETCPVDLKTIVGGFSGIKRTFGCWPAAKPWTGDSL
jgi:hypothetical protein